MMEQDLKRTIAESNNGRYITFNLKVMYLSWLLLDHITVGLQRI